MSRIKNFLSRYLPMPNRRAVQQFKDLKQKVESIEKKLDITLKQPLLANTPNDMHDQNAKLINDNKKLHYYGQALKRELELCLGRSIIDEFYQLPDSVRIDASTLCQLDCPACYMRLNDSGFVGKGYVKFDDFKNFIDRHSYIKSVELANNGEIFLNPDISSIIQYAFKKNVKLRANAGVNFNTVSDEVIKALVKYRFAVMTISIDGASQDVYSAYRRNGNYNRVLENIKKLNKYKKEYKSDYPKLVWQYVIMEHNEDDVINAKVQAKQLDMEIRFKLTWDRNYTPKKTEMLTKETGLLFFTRESRVANDTKKINRFAACKQLFTDPQINYDGRLLGCCCVYKSDFGVNVFEIGLEEALKSDQVSYAKKLLQGKLAPASLSEHLQKVIPCIDCGYYKQMVQSEVYIEF